MLNYSLSCDKIGLLKYFRCEEGKIHFYHVHSDELTTLERFIHKYLLWRQNNYGR